MEPLRQRIATTRRELEQAEQSVATLQRDRQPVLAQLTTLNQQLQTQRANEINARNQLQAAERDSTQSAQQVTIAQRQLQAILQLQLRLERAGKSATHLLDDMQEAEEAETSAQTAKAQADARAQSARTALTQATARIAQLQIEIQTNEPRLTQLNQSLTHATLRVTTLRTQLQQLEAERAQWQQVNQQFAPMPATTLPIALLPVRLETRFVTRQNPPELLIRVYPDDVHIDTHEPPLTDAERQAGQQFWEQTWRVGLGTDEAALAQRRSLWAQLAQSFSSQRAAWIVQALQPLNPQGRPAATISPEQPLPVPITFPQPPPRTESWSRAPRTQVLPDRWVALGYRAQKRVLLQWGNPIPDTLATGPDPNQFQELPNDQLPIDEGMRWMVEFNAAEQVGMGLRVKFSSAQEAQQGFDQLLVLGLKTSLNGVNTATRLTKLLNAHRFTAGIAFVPQGTPTNNTTEKNAGYSTHDPGFGLSYEAERTRTPLGDRANATLTAQALGLEPPLFHPLPHAAAEEQQDAQHMQTVLWPVTWGYFLEQLMNPGIFDPAIRKGRRHFIDHVRARGPLPVLRVGSQPYGLLPVTALDFWTSLEDSATDTSFVKQLRLLQAHWQAALPQVPKLVTNATQAQTDAALLRVLSMGATSHNYSARPVLDSGYLRGLMRLISAPDGFSANPGLGPLATQEAQAQSKWRNLGFNSTSRITKTLPSPSAFPLEVGWVEDPNFPNYLNWLQQADHQTLQQESQMPAAATKPKALLYLLLRHAKLLEYTKAAFRLLLRRGLITEQQGQEAALVDMDPEQPTPTRWRQLQIRIPELTQDKTLGQFLDQLPLTNEAIRNDPDLTDFIEFRESLAYLRAQFDSEAIATAPEPLELLLAETLDLSSHRLDAWITSFATKRLHWLRQRQPKHLLLGGFGWVENLRPALPSQPVPPPPGEAGSPLSKDPNSAGFIQAPSIAHAATAAILRSGYRSHAEPAQARQSPFAVDLSSERVRLALSVMDGVRQGQSLGALLGYRFERSLHDHQLDRFIAPFRKLAPFEPISTERAEPAAMEAIATQNVVDGLELLHRWQAGQQSQPPRWDISTIPFGTRNLPTLAQVTLEFRQLEEAVDAMSDAMLSESVYQMVQGNAVRANAALNAFTQIDQPIPELEVLRTPRSGLGITHRVLMLLHRPNEEVTTWHITATQVRAKAEPTLNAWVAQRLGPSRQIRCQADYLDATNTVVAQRDVRLSELAISPLDLVYLAQPAAAAQRSELEQRFLYYLQRSPLPTTLPETTIRLNFDRQPQWSVTDLSVAEAMVMARSLHQLISNARALTAEDLDLPEHVVPFAADLTELKTRTDQIFRRFQQIHTELVTAIEQTAPLDDLRDLLLRIAYFGLPGAVPLSVTGETEGDRQTLLDQATSLQQEIRRILDQIQQAEGELNAAAPEAQLDHQRQRLRLILGTDFRVLPILRPANTPVLEQAFAASTTLQGNDPTAVVKWLQRSAYVREGTARLDAALLYAEAIGTGSLLDLKVGQLPLVTEQTQRWAALPLSSDQPLPGSVLSLVAYLPDGFKATEPLAGLLVDEWVEVIPNPSETSGVAFHFDEPNSRAPQTILLAVSPDEQPVWDFETLEAIALETLELSKLRTVDPNALESVAELGDILPALYLSFNLAGDTLSTDFTRARAPSPP